MFLKRLSSLKNSIQPSCQIEIDISTWKLDTKKSSHYSQQKRFYDGTILKLI